MATNPLVQTVFSTGPKDNLAAIDPYKTKPGNKPINSIQALSEKLGIDIGGIFGNLNAAAALGSVIKIAGGGSVAFDKNALTARLLATSSKINSSYRTLSDSAKNNMTSMLGMESSMNVKIGDISSMVDSYQIDSVKGLGTFLADYTGNKNICSIEDTDALGGMIGGLVTEGSNLGINGIFPSLTEGITDVSLISKAAQNAMPGLLQNGDLSTIFEISQSPAGKGMGVLFPDLAKDLASAFRINGSRGTQDLLGDFGKYLGSMNNIFGDWDRVVRSGDGEDSFTINLFRMLGSSRSFQDMILTGVMALTDDGDEKKNYLVHGLYKETTVEAEIKRFFPQVVLISKSDSPRMKIDKKSTLDPRTLMRLGSMVGTVLAS